MTDTAVKLERSTLVQRLQAPTGGPNPFSFGAFQGGGLSDEAHELLAPVFSFDYMGSAEYETGAVPRTLSHLFELGAAGKLGVKPIKVGRSVVYLLADASLLTGEPFDELCRRIRSWGTEPYPSDDTLRDPTLLYFALDEKERTDNSRLGWLELNNHLFFSIDTEMFVKTCELVNMDKGEVLEAIGAFDV